MKVTDIHLEHELPVAVHVEMTIEEAEVIAAVLGAIVPADLAIAAGPGYEPVPGAVCDALVGTVFNRFWEGGIDEVMTRFANIELRREGR